MLGSPGQLEKEAVHAERQIWQRAQSMSPSPAYDTEIKSNGSPCNGSLSSVEAMDNMRKGYDKQLEAAKTAHSQETMDFRRENALLKQRLHNVNTERSAKLDHGRTAVQLQAELEGLKHSLALKEVALLRALADVESLSESESATHGKHSLEKRGREHREGVQTMAHVLSKWTRDSKLSAVILWRTSFQEQKPIAIDTAKVKALESEASGYRTQIRQLLQEVKEAMESVRESKRLHSEELSHLQADRKQLEKIISSAPDSAESAVLRREIIDSKNASKAREAALAEDIANLKIELRMKNVK